MVVSISAKEVNLVFKTIDTDIKGQITFDQFAIYFSKYVMDETTSAECVNGLRKAFLEADRDGSGTLNFREFTEYVWEKKRSIRMSKIINSFSKGTKDEINFTDFQQLSDL
jgi:Ca2+-binding EF-hand superfamily protein